MVGGQCPRVLINLDRVGGIGSGKNDLVLLGKCDDIIRDLAKELGWEDELDKAWAATAASLENDEATPSTPTKRKDQTDGTDLASEVEKIVEKLEGALTISEKDKPDIEADKSIRATGETGKGKDAGDKERATAQQKTPNQDPKKGERTSGREEKGVPVSLKHDRDITLLFLPLPLHNRSECEDRPTYFSMVVNLGCIRRDDLHHDKWKFDAICTLHGTSLLCLHLKFVAR
jgi:hypothetical protein